MKLASLERKAIGRLSKLWAAGEADGDTVGEDPAGSGAA
jgi:hypothetical protein